MGVEMSSVSIIIPAWNEAKTLKQTLEALLEIDYDKKRCGVIVVAGGDDDTYEIAQGLSSKMGTFSKYVVIRQRRKGTKNAAIQQGLKEAQNDVIVLLDADTIVTERWLTSMVAPIEQGICDLTIANSEPIRRNWISDYYMIIKTYFIDRVTTYSGHSIAFRADMIEDKIEYFFDHNVWMGDDYLFEKRVSEQGRKTMFIKNANVRTHFPCSLKYFLKIESRWWTAFINMNGVSYKTLTCNIVVIGALVCAIPFSGILSMFSLLFNTLYIAKRAHIFLVASRQYKTKVRRILGFVVLSYVHHIILFVSHMRCFLGLWRDTYYQGQRY
jgi:cellulose synthase/poly-beta-1,6-N-acetylglucosamine synthase-like glycosyltransferase